MNKNQAAQKLCMFFFDTLTGLGKTGDAANLTAYVRKDFGTLTVLADTSVTEVDATNARGWYDFDLAQAETNADDLLFTGKSTTANVACVGNSIAPVPIRFGSMLIGVDFMVQVAALVAADIRAAMGLAAANLDTQLDAIPTNAELASAISALSIAPSAAAIRTAVGLAAADLDLQLGAIPTNGELTSAIGALSVAPSAAAIRAAVGLATANLDMQLDAIPTNAELAAADDATLAAIGAISSAPSALDIASAVWNASKASHVSVGSTGAALNDTDDRGARTVLRGTVAAGATNSEFTVSATDTPGASVNQFKGRVILFDKATATPALRGQATLIQGNTADALPTFTVSALTIAPAVGDVFSVV